MLKEKLKNISQEIYQPIKEIIDDGNSKKYFIYLIIIYLIGYASILIADVYYIDDLGRSIRGFSRWEDFSRHLSNVFSKFIHMGWRLSDISPLTQFIAIAILSTSSILLVKIINGRLQLVPIIASTCIGLFPYFLQNFSYKFDSPYMAFAIFSSVFPFLWYRSKKIYFVAFSVLGVLGTLLTYQAASGVYIIIFIALATKDFLQKNKTAKQVLAMAIWVAFSYILALLIYRYFLLEDDITEYRTVSMLPISELPMGMLLHLKQYWLTIKNDLSSGFIGYAFVFLCLWYIVKLQLLSEHNKLFSLLVSVISLIVMSLFLWGVLIALIKTLLPPRAYLTVGLFVGILASIEIKENKYYQWVNQLFVGVFVYSLLAFSNAYGNALQAQNKYETFRLTLAVSDLSKFISDRQDLMLYLTGDIGHAKAVINASHHYPLMKKLVRITAGGEERPWTRVHAEHFGLQFVKKKLRHKTCKKNTPKMILHSTAFHDIAKNSDCYYIIFK